MITKKIRAELDALDECPVYPIGPEAFVLASSGGLTLTISPAEALAFFTEYLQKHCPMIAVVLLAEVKDTTQLLDFLRFLHTDDAPSAKQHCGSWPRQASDN